MGDMNAEPHEPAMRALASAGVIFVPPAPPAEGGSSEAQASAPPPPTPTPTPAPREVAQCLGGDALGSVSPLCEVAEGGGASAAAPPCARGAAPALCDTWRALFDEPPPRSPDAALRRYAFTFPSDDPVKRIDLVFAGCGAAARAGDAAPAPPAAGAAPSCAALARCGARVEKTWLVGQDPVPGTDVTLGQAGVGMTSERSPIFASDHRGVVVELSVAV
jgi:hypothetical protein